MLIISSLVSVSVEIPFTCQSSNSTTSFVLFFVIKTPVWRLDSGLTDGGGECGETERWGMDCAENAQSKQPE